MERFIEIIQFCLVLFGFMICGLFLTSTLSLIPIENTFASQWIIFSGQNLLAFFIPSILAWRICFKARGLHAMEADQKPTWHMIGIALLVYAAGVPALNQIVYWNQEIHFPDAMAAFEDWCRDMERLAEEQTDGLLNSGNVGVMLMNILVIGAITGICEECFFRGSLQRMLVYCDINLHVAVWTSAVVFSFLHFQFFGFIPRVLLGAWFGYLYLWSGSLWINALAHALNNSLVIISAWCINRGILSEQFDMLGVSTDSFPVWALLSACTVGGLLWCFRKQLYHRETYVLDR